MASVRPPLSRAVHWLRSAQTRQPSAGKQAVLPGVIAMTWPAGQVACKVFYFADDVLKYLMSKFEDGTKSKTEETT